MKVRNSFVTNSSSSSFLITNISDYPKTLKDYIHEIEDEIGIDYKERRQFWEDEKDEWFLNKYPNKEAYIEEALKDAEALYDGILEPGESIERECGDHHEDDGLAQYFIHSETWNPPIHPSFDIQCLESHH